MTQARPESSQAFRELAAPVAHCTGRPSMQEHDVRRAHIHVHARMCTCACTQHMHTHGCAGGMTPGQSPAPSFAGLTTPPTLTMNNPAASFPLSNSAAPTPCAAPTPGQPMFGSSGTPVGDLGGAAAQPGLLGGGGFTIGAAGEASGRAGGQRRRVQVRRRN